MNENLNGSSSEARIDLPSKLRIRQRLGMVSTGNAFQRQVVPRVVRMGGQSLPVSEFLSDITTKLTGFPDGGSEMSELGHSVVPKIINGIVDNEQQRNIALQQWSELSVSPED